MKRLIAAAAAATFALGLATPAAATYQVGCVIYPGPPEKVAGMIVSGLGDMLCRPDIAARSRMQVVLQEKKVLRFQPDEWHSKRSTAWTTWSQSVQIDKRVSKACNSRDSKHEWRLYIHAQFIPIVGYNNGAANGADYSEPVTLDCHVDADELMKDGWG